MNEPARQAAEAALRQLCLDGSPVVRSDQVEKILKVAERRWLSFGRRHPQRDGDLAARTQDLAKGLCDHFEGNPRLAGPLLEDYRHLAEVLAREFAHDETDDAPSPS